MKLKTDSCYVRHTEGRICQGDIYRDIKYFLWIDIKGKEIDGADITFPYLVVLTQECDLDLDFKYRTETCSNNDKCLQSILVSPAYLAEKLRYGIHLEELEMKMERLNANQWSVVKRNQNPRYHHLPAYEEYKIPELVIDFKHYYTISRDYFYQYFQKQYIGTIEQLFRESLSQRFSYYLSRIGLPVLPKED